MISEIARNIVALLLVWIGGAVIARNAGAPMRQALYIGQGAQAVAIGALLLAGAL